MSGKCNGSEWANGTDRRRSAVSKWLVSKAPFFKSSLNGRKRMGLQRGSRLGKIGRSGGRGMYKIKIELYMIHLEAKQSRNKWVRNNDPIKVYLEGRVNGTEANPLTEGDSTLLLGYLHGATSRKTGILIGTTSLTSTLTHTLEMISVSRSKSKNVKLSL
jgi:hypothetical protein